MLDRAARRESRRPLRGSAAFAILAERRHRSRRSESGMTRWILMIAAAAIAASLFVAAAARNPSDDPVPSSRSIFPKVLREAQPAEH
jgi:hypothetical protein